jgi:glycosyltransferase involved in cell wall biosynthesis
MRIRIVEAADQLGLGGTERALENYCNNLDRSRFDVTAVGFRAGGLRADILRLAGHEVIVADGNARLWEEVIRRADVLHWHGDGLLAPEVFEVVRRNKPKLVIQTNVFGLDGRGLYSDLIDADLYISSMCLVRRVREDRQTSLPLKHNRMVLHYPVDLDKIKEAMPAPSEVEAFRRETGLGRALVVGRVGRPADEKFHSVAVDMMWLLREWFPGIKFLLVGPTLAMRQRVRRFGLDPCFVFVDPTVDLKALLTCYRCMDVYLATSQIGESFGMNIAEAMACGLPIVAISTPEADNAQVELVDNGVNGLVVEAYPRLVALACRELVLNEALRQAMGQAAAEKVKQYAALRIVRRLENLIYQRLGIERLDVSDGELPLLWSEDLRADYERQVNDLYLRPTFPDRARAWVRRRGGRAKLKLSQWLAR